MAADRPQIVPIAMHHVAGFREALGAVARERAFLAQIEAPPMEWAKGFCPQQHPE